MTREKMKKYKIALGICGPRVLYTNIIKAHSKEEAVDKYISEKGKPCSETERERLLYYTAEYESKPRTEKVDNKSTDTADDFMNDYEMNKVQVGDCVAFICLMPNEKGFRRYNVQEGVITKMTKTSAEIYSEKMGQTYRVMVTSGAYDGNDFREPRLKKVAKLFNKYESEDGVFADALSQSVHEGDVAACMADMYQDSCPGFIKMKVQKVTNNFAMMEGGKRRTAPKFAVIQRNS